MKLSNIFKKGTNNSLNASVEKLEKNQLAQVIGGTETTPTEDPETEENRVKKGGQIKGNININNGSL